ncbi:MAG TPA: malonate decarboxylase holo-ACP synthase [Acidobacteriaceae bacterium]
MDPATIRGIRTQDLLELRSPVVTREEEKEFTTPEWAESALRAIPFVVVRRGYPSTRHIPVGVRGPERHHRWAALTSPENVKRILTPASILQEWRDKDLPRNLHAFRALRALLERWQRIEHQWGPSGSVGFELATGVVTSTEASDLDLVILASNPMPVDASRFLLLSTSDLPARVDILIETPQCGFALREYVDAHGAPILLRTPSGPRLGSDPWDTNLSTRNGDVALSQFATDILRQANQE